MDETVLTGKVEELVNLGEAYEYSFFSDSKLREEGIEKAKDLVNSINQTDLQTIENYVIGRVKSERLKGLASFTAGVSGGFILGQLIGVEEATTFITVAGIYLGGLHAIGRVRLSMMYPQLQKAITNDFYSGRTGLTASVS